MYLKRLGEVRAQRCQMARANLYSLISGLRETFFMQFWTLFCKPNVIDLWQDDFKWYIKIYLAIPLLMNIYFMFSFSHYRDTVIINLEVFLLFFCRIHFQKWNCRVKRYRYFFILTLLSRRHSSSPFPQWGQEVPFCPSLPEVVLSLF